VLCQKQSIMMHHIAILLAILATIRGVRSSATPVVLWHGMGDTCCNPFSLGKMKQILEQEIPGVYVNSLMFGRTMMEDASSGYYGHVNDLIELACKTIKKDVNLTSGYNGIGFSQGSQFLRGIAQRCPNPPMKNLISLGGQHQGVYGLPHCPGESTAVCNTIRKMLNLGAYSNYMQRHIVQAQYWHDPLNEEEYEEKSLFIAEINNQKKRKNATYVQNLLQLKKLVLVQFQNDTMIDPKESSSFGFFEPGQGKKILPMRETRLYQEDWIGLKQLDQSGKLVEYRVPGDHLQLNIEWFKSELIAKYLK